MVIPRASRANVIKSVVNAAPASNAAKNDP
jgi:hypothetical protein